MTERTTRPQGPRTVEDAYAEAEKDNDKLRAEIERLRAALKQIAEDQFTDDSGLQKIASDALAHEQNATDYRMDGSQKWQP